MTMKLGITLMIYFELSVIRRQFLFQETIYAKLFRNYLEIKFDLKTEQDIKFEICAANL